ncbi:MAG TPA: STAS domain-containing protein [Pyrinomonadaceae bacterium]|nr:STAS domain-containing protein [Pyrinomonadaceae bacterium]
MLKVQTRNFGNVAVLNLQGQVVNGQTDILRDAVQALSLPATSTLKLDLARVTTVDAGGLGVMLELREQFQSNGIRFELMNVPKQIRRVFEITRLDSVFQITSTVESFPAVSRNRRSSVGVHHAPLASCA